MGKCTTMYQAVKTSDPKLQNSQSVEKCLHILTFLRMLLQVVLPKESLCWLVYNGTIHIYSISRYLMSYGHCSKVIEFLLWSSVCMETSGPLLSVKYLPWRTILYTSVCQCYYDCRAGSNAESFARRGLSKINELSQLENMSSGTENPQSELIFREATVKMAIMVFKRSVFETRRKPKNLLRPKTRANLKDAQGLPWPRTPTEKLLSDMFEGSAAQFLCILESLTDASRRTLVTSPPAQDSEPEILDVYAELIMAGQEILAGGGGTYSLPKAGSITGLAAMQGINNTKSLITMASLGEDGVPLSAAVRLVKLAYCYEQWEAFDLLVDRVLSYIRMLNDNRYTNDEKALEILLAMERVNASRRHKRQTSAIEDSSVINQDSLHHPPSQLGGTSTRSLSQGCDDLIQLADVLMSVVNGKFTKESFCVDMMVDGGLFLWKKCKAIFEKYQTGSDNAKYLQRMEQPGKWLYILDSVHQILCWCGISRVDPALTSEVVLRLALVLESAAQMDFHDDSRSQLKESTTDMGAMSAGEFASHTVVSHLNVQMSILYQGVREQLLQARDILELGLEHVSIARQTVAHSDGKSIADIGWVKELNRDLFSPESAVAEAEVSTHSETEETKSEDEKVVDIDHEAFSQSSPATALWSTIKDLHLELLLMYHRVCLKLAALGPDPAMQIKKPYRRVCTKVRMGSSQQMAGHYVETVEELTARCNKSLISKALLNMQRAIINKTDITSAPDQRKLLEDTVTLITRAQVDEKRLYVDNTIDWNAPPKVAKVPPAPVLMSRTHTRMVFRPAPFTPSSGEKVAWYTLFGRSSTGSSVKVRLADTLLNGTGQQVPAFDCEICASGLLPNERYVFALAAYTDKGKLIGDSIGEMCRPVLASHPLPVLMTWAFLSQVAYQVGCYNISQQACKVLWDHFVAPPPAPEGDTYVTRVQKDYRLTLYKLNKKVVLLSSPVLIRQTLTSVFISVDICVRQNELFPDVLCSMGPLYTGQINRLHQCEKMLLALELAGWLNEANLALQGVVQCYGLLAPLLFHNIPCIAVMQVLEFCHAALQEIPAGLRQKRQASIAESLHHMTACITYYLCKVLRMLGQKTLASNLNEAGRKLLCSDSTDHAEQKQTGSPEQKDKSDMTVAPDSKTGEANKAPHLKKRTKRKHPSPFRDEGEPAINEELKALEAHMMTITKLSQSDHELTGYEDPNVLHAYIAFLPSKVVFKELVKFKRRARYLEFLVQLVQKALSEGQPEMALDWCEDAHQWIAKRNEQILGIRPAFGKQVGGPNVTGEDPKKFAAAMVEYSRDKSKPVDVTPRNKGSQATARQALVRPNKRRKYKAINVTSNMSETARQHQEGVELNALDTLTLHFPELYRSFLRRRRLRKLITEEMPYLVQMNILQGMSQFNDLLQKLEKREKVLGSAANKVFRTSFLDQEWFTLETTGTLIVGWEGGPTAPVDRLSNHSLLAALDLADRQEAKTTGIEIAAAAATGHAPTTLNVIAEALFEDTPRTYRSDIGPYKPDHKQHKEPTVTTLTTKVTTECLEKTFMFFTRAVVLAHRGRHWTLLQNASRALWNCIHTAMLRAYTPTTSSQDAGLVSMDILRALMWEPLSMASLCILDMITQLQGDLETQAKKAKIKGHNLGRYFESWMGNIAMEKGAASLAFESPLDDIGIVDIRWVKRLVLRSLEVMFHEHKWERLADIALRFTDLSNNRYAEQVLPLLVQAQRNLTEQISRAGGPRPVQPHFRRLRRQLGHVVTAKDYVKSQLTIDIKKHKSKSGKSQLVDLDSVPSYTDIEGCQLVSVPLDVMGTLESLRAALDQSNYTARALQHSRKLLVLYLAGQQNVESCSTRETSHVDFVANPDHPQPVMPPDLKGEEFRYIGDIQSSPLPKSQLSTVISSYDKTITILLAKNHRSAAAQASHELGNLHYHAGNIRAAYKWWSEGLDLVLNLPDSLHTWRQTLYKKEETSSDLLQRCGLWGCVLAGILASKIAQYVITSDLGLRMECCFLSGYLFKALFCSSLPHPTADRDYALYEVGEGCEVTHLVPGIDLLSDKFRADGRQLVAALRWVTEELARGRYNLFVLPLLTLNQYLTTYVCRDLQRSVDGRILKVRVLTDTGLFLEAFITLQRLLQGERLPHTGDSNFRQVQSKVSAARFNTGKSITDPNNIKVVEFTLEKRLSSNLATLYGPHMTCHLLLAQAHLLVTLAENIPVMPLIDHSPSDPPKTQSNASISQTSKGLMPHSTVSAVLSKGAVNHTSMAAMPSVKRGANMSTSGDTQDKEGDRSSDNEGILLAKRLTETKEPVTMELVKGTMLGVADQMVTSLSDVLVEAAQFDQGVERLAAAELELVVLCRLEQAAIAVQKHHAPMAARIVLSAMKMMQNSELFKTVIKPPTPPSDGGYSQNRPSSLKSKSGSGHGRAHDVPVTEADNSQFTYQNFQSRSRLDARLWLQCRLALVRTLLSEIRGLGDVKGSENKVVTDLADCRQYCAEGVAEAEACGDAEMQSEFFLQAALLNIMEGKSLENTLLILQDIKKLLGDVPHLSLAGDHLFSVTLMLLADLEGASKAPGTADPSALLNSYLTCQDIILKQMEDLGEAVEHYYPVGERRHFSSAVCPIQNIYLPHMLRLAQVKLRIGYTMARQIALSNSYSSYDGETQWSECLGVLMTAMELSQASLNRQAALEAEIILNMGKVQRQLAMLGRYQPRSAVSTLLEAIKISYSNDHDLGLIRQGYLEIALVYLYSSGMIGRQVSATDLQSDSEGEGSLASRPSSQRRSGKRWKSKKERLAGKSKEELGDSEKERRAAWLAIRCAASVAQAQRQRSLLCGDPTITAQQLTEKMLKDLPEFVPLDLLSPYILGKQKKVYRTEIEEELSTMVDVQEERHVETYDDEVMKMKASAADLSLVHLLGYQSILQRLCCTSTLHPSSGGDGKETDKQAGSLIGFDLGFISHAQMYAGLNSDVVRTMLRSSYWALRLTHMHSFLSHHVPLYASTCCAIFPPDALALPPCPNTSITELSLISHSYSDYVLEKPSGSDVPFTDSNLSQDVGSTIHRTPPPGSRMDIVKPTDKTVVSSNENELSMQWYQPSLEENELTGSDLPQSRRRVMLLYSICKKGSSSASAAQTGQLWVSLPDLLDLHDRLAVLSQKGEISLLDKPKKEISTPTPTPTPLKTKKAQRIKALSPKVQRDEHLENLLKQCVEDCSCLLGGQIPEAEGAVSETSLPEFPFEVTKTNLKNFEMLFDPSFGLTLRGGDLMTWMTKQFHCN
ncbi:cilia- and flagella-associated protein 54-like isoform X2 [Liolophura sinensis]|uniref:cilia- and flagella-associated protein 54-like isoform X2 n=1 Tax=Liolophura sinensis TaxID=3198878 RepID=UPI00315909E8